MTLHNITCEAEALRLPGGSWRPPWEGRAPPRFSSWFDQRTIELNEALFDLAGSSWANWAYVNVSHARTHAVDCFGRAGLEQWNQSRHHCSENNLYHSRRWLCVASNSSRAINQLLWISAKDEKTDLQLSTRSLFFFFSMANHSVTRRDFNYTINNIIEKQICITCIIQRI